MSTFDEILNKAETSLKLYKTSKNNLPYKNVKFDPRDYDMFHNYLYGKFENTKIIKKFLKSYVNYISENLENEPNQKLFNLIYLLGIFFDDILQCYHDEFNGYKYDKFIDIFDDEMLINFIDSLSCENEIYIEAFNELKKFLRG